MSITDRRPYLIQKLIFKKTARVGHKLGTIWPRQVNLILTAQDTRNVVGKFPQESFQPFKREAVQVHENTQIALAQMRMHLIQHRGFASAALAVKDDHVVAVLPNESLLDEIKDILAAKEHLRAGDRAACDVGGYDVGHKSSSLCITPKFYLSAQNTSVYQLWQKIWVH